MLVRDHLRQHGNQDWPPCREYDIANSVGHGVAESREVALRLFLDRAKRGRDRPRAGTSTQDNDRVHPQHITTEQDRHGVRENRDHNAHEDQADARLLEPREKAGPCGKPYAGHEDGQTDGIEDPHGGPWDPTECRVNRAQPAEDETHDQRAATRGQCERQAADCDTKQSNQAAEDDAETDEEHVRHHRLPVGVAEVFGGPLDVARSSDESHDIASLYLRRGRERHRLADPRQLLQEHTPGEIHARQIYNGFAHERLVGDHHVEELDRKIQKLFVTYLGPDLGPAGHQQFRARQNCDDVTLANDHVWDSLDDLAVPADPGYEDTSFFRTRFQFAHARSEERR